MKNKSVASTVPVSLARNLIPGGSHTYAKGDDQFPENAPKFLERGKGCRVWSTDGREFIEYGMGLRSVTLGHVFEPVVEAVARQLQFGANLGRPTPIEVECAETFLRAVPTAQMVKFCKDGSTAVDGAVRLARAWTGRDKVAICADHPFYSTSDWFIGTTAMSAGVPENVRRQILKFCYNDIGSVTRLFEEHREEIACIVLEPARTEEPTDDFLQKLRDVCTHYGALLVFDEMITGFRWHRSGAQHVYGVTPDLSAFGKAMGNGFAISALAGRRDIMSLGADDSSKRVFLLSTTYGAESHAMAAAIATMNTYAEAPVVPHLYAMGARLRAGVQEHAERLGISEYFHCVGRDCCLLFVTKDGTGTPSQDFRTLFMQEMIERGVLAPSFVVSYSHQAADVDATIAAVGESLRVYAEALRNGVKGYLRGRPVRPVFGSHNPTSTAS